MPERKTVGSQTEGIVTVITIGNPTNPRSDADRITVLAPSSASLHSSKNASTSTREIRFPSSIALASPQGSQAVLQVCDVQLNLIKLCHKIAYYDYRYPVSGIFNR